MILIHKYNQFCSLLFMTDKCFSHSNYKTYSYDLTINTDTFPVHLFLQIKFLEESIMELEGMKVFIKKIL